MLYEISRRSISISKHEETSFDHHNSLLTVRADKHLHLLEFSYNVECLDKQLDFVESSIACPKNSATSEFLENYASKGIKNMELVELITDPFLWSYSKHLKQEMTNIMAFEWSPTNFIYNNQSVLAVLNTVGNVEFFGPKRKLWVSLMDFSSIIKQYIMSKSHLHNEHRKFMKIEKLKDLVYSISTTAICWAPNLNDDGSCYFVTAQRNGSILFWISKFEETELKVNKLGKIEVDNIEITTLLWIPSTSIFLFVYANVLGEVIGKVCKIDNENICDMTTIPLWKHKDRMVSKNIQYTILNDKILIIYSKHRHLVVQMFDRNFKLLSEVVNLVNDERITVVTKAKRGIYIGTVNTKIYKLCCIINENDLIVKFESIELKDSFANHNLYGLAFSTNDIVCHIVAIDRKVNYRKEQLQMLIISLTSNDNELENTLFNSDSSNKLTNMWDCIELLRYKTMKTKKLPTINFVAFYKDADTDIYKLKIYLIVVKLYNSLEGILKNLSKGLLPETSIEVVQDKILASHASSCIVNIYQKHKDESNLPTLEYEWLFGCSKYLEYYCKKYDILTEKLISNEIWNNVIHIFTTSNLPPYTCLLCDDKIEGFACTSGHINMFCSITLTQIDAMEYLMCKCCNIMARMELYQNKPSCVFCDSHLDYYNLLA